jgi:hypothetical protein
LALDGFIDCANGVGAVLLGTFEGDCARCGLQLQLENVAFLEDLIKCLRKGCGSDFVQNRRVLQ